MNTCSLCFLQQTFYPWPFLQPNHLAKIMASVQLWEVASLTTTTKDSRKKNCKIFSYIFISFVCIFHLFFFLYLDPCRITTKNIYLLSIFTPSNSTEHCIQRRRKKGLQEKFWNFCKGNDFDRVTVSEVCLCLPLQSFHTFPDK